jgi:hypothetical protein
VRWGVEIARKGRRAEEVILNCLSLSEIAAFFAQRDAVAPRKDRDAEARLPARRSIEGEAHQCAARDASGSMAPLFSRNM